MNKQELVDFIAEKAGITGAAAKRAVDAFAEAVGTTVKAGDEVAILGFGTFKPKETAARSGRNPRTGEALQIAAGKSVSFKAGKGLKDALKG